MNITDLIEESMSSLVSMASYSLDSEDLVKAIHTVAIGMMAYGSYKIGRLTMEQFGYSATLLRSYDFALVKIQMKFAELMGNPDARAISKAFT